MMGPREVSQERTVRGFVSGRVQGVGFRWFVLQAARRFGLRGRVRNLPDGCVEFVAQGEGERVDRLLEAIRQGPAGSRVEGIETNEVSALPRYEEFMIE